jgi:periplasmic copper chaperone A
MKKRCAALFYLLIATPVLAHSYQQKSIQIGHAWALPTDSSQSQAYFPLLNTGASEDQLIGMSSPAAKSIIYIDRFGTVQSSLRLSPKMPVALRKGGAYLQLKGLNRQLKSGAKIPLILQFEKAGRITIELWIERTPYAKTHQP